MMMLMGIVGLNLGAAAQQAPERTGLSDKNVLVAYFSCTGTTERVAQAIAKSGLFGMKTPEQALALMLVAMLMAGAAFWQQRRSR